MYRVVIRPQNNNSRYLREDLDLIASIIGDSTFDIVIDGRVHSGVTGLRISEGIAMATVSFEPSEINGYPVGDVELIAADPDDAAHFNRERNRIRMDAQIAVQQHIEQRVGRRLPLHLRATADATSVLVVIEVDLRDGDRCWLGSAVYDVATGEVSVREFREDVADRAADPVSV